MSTSTSLVVVGDALLDVDLDGDATRLAPDAPAPVLADLQRRPRPGGAALAALLGARRGLDVVLLTATAADRPGDELRQLLDAAGVEVVPVATAPCTTTKVRARARGQTLLRLDTDGDGCSDGVVDERAAAALAGADAILAADYGRGVLALPVIREALAGAAAPIVWDPHPRGSAPVAGVRLAVPCAAEAAALAGNPAGRLAVDIASGQACLRAWSAAGVAVTRGADGAVLVEGRDRVLVVPAPPVGAGADPCGAGDRFAVEAAAVLGEGGLPSEAVEAAVEAASAFVAAGGAAAVGSSAQPGGAADLGAAAAGAGGARRSPRRDGAAAEVPGGVGGGMDAALAVAARVRAAGGTVVATGGCFDLLHAGHVRLLQAARRLGDCLIVLANDDDSVRALKGPDRPISPARDRLAVLEAIEGVDAAVAFSGPTPIPALEVLRPDVWVKGGDYDADRLPEGPVLRSWGGRAVTVPYLDGRSTTGMISRIRG